MNKTLGIVIIAKNESANIRDCLSSVQDADEIILLDTGSTDDTMNIAAAFGAQIYEDPWRDDFSYSRNKAISYSTTDYYLIIDCDEILRTPIKQIKKIINEFWFRKHFGMFFNIEMVYEKFDSPRLFKNVPEIYYINAAHNVPTWRGDCDSLVTRLYKSSFVIESGYSEAHKLDPDRTLRILQKKLEVNPEDTRTLYYIAREWLNRKDVKQATGFLEKYRDMKYKEADRWDNELADVFFLLAMCYADEETWGEMRWFDAVNSAMWSFNILPTQSDVCNFLSKCFLEMPGSVDGAVRSQLRTSKFWETIGSTMKDEGILMKRI
jgi:glycosyltransferase involved in cell wall biosynthesis